MRPRHYALAYLVAKGDPVKERKAVENCPSEWQELVRTHVKIIEGRKAHVEHKQNNKNRPRG